MIIVSTRKTVTGRPGGRRYHFSDRARRFPGNAAWNQGDVGQVSERFLYYSGNNSDRIVLLGRSMMAVVGAGLCLLIFFCSNRLFGAIGGLISELLAVFDPNPSRAFSADYS